MATDKILPDVILFNFPLFVDFMFISKVFKLQFPLCLGRLSPTRKKFNWKDSAPGKMVPLHKLKCRLLIGQKSNKKTNTEEINLFRFPSSHAMNHAFGFEYTSVLDSR